MTEKETEDQLLRSVALQNAKSILLARKRAEQALVAAQEELRETAHQLQLALDAGKLGAWTWDAPSDQLTLAPRAAEMFGVSSETSLTRAQMRELLHADDGERARSALDQALASRSDYDVEYRLKRRPDGATVWIGAKGRGNYAPDGAVLGMTGVMQDISARKHTELDNARLYEEVKRAAEERNVLLESERAARSYAERTNSMKDDFLATLSHELRTPLSAILGWSHALRSRRMGEDELRQGLEKIERNARMQAQLIEDLLDMSRIASGKVRLDVQPVEPISFIEAAVETVRPAAEAKGIRLEKRLDPSAGPINGDPQRLQQIVWNLLSNAIKFTPKDGKVQVLLERVNSHVEFSVADTGIGIEAQFLPHVFERFRQADASTTRRFGGLGLGLSIVKHLVELHGGTVHVKSAGEGCGSTFSVHLPVTVVHTAGGREERVHPRTPASAPPETFKPVDLAGIKVLVVDDEPDARELIQRVLLDCNAEVHMAANAAEALRLVEKEKPHVLVSDIGMPEVDGYELLRRVRALGSARGGNVRAIALTAFARSEDRTRALRAGFQVHVAKPVEPPELIATVANAAGRWGDTGQD